MTRPKKCRPKAINSGTLFEGLLDCYVLDDGRRIVSQRGIVRSLTDGRDRGDLGQYLDHLPKRFKDLATATTIEFVRPEGGMAIGREGAFLVNLANAYISAFMRGELHRTQVHLAVNAQKFLEVVSNVGIRELIDAATGYQKQREDSVLSFAQEVLLRPRPIDWQLLWPTEFVDAICRLYGKHYNGGSHPQWLSAIYDRLYCLILGDAVVKELRERNPKPQFGSNHHQWLTEEARAIVEREIPIVTELARQSSMAAEFWARLEVRYRHAPLQLTFNVPQRVSRKNQR